MVTHIASLRKTQLAIHCYTFGHVQNNPSWFAIIPQASQRPWIFYSFWVFFAIIAVESLKRIFLRKTGQIPCRKSFANMLLLCNLNAPKTGSGGWGGLFSTMPTSIVHFCRLNAEYHTWRSQSKSCWGWTWASPDRFLVNFISKWSLILFNIQYSSNDCFSVTYIDFLPFNNLCWYLYRISCL